MLRGGACLDEVRAIAELVLELLEAAPQDLTAEQVRYHRSRYRGTAGGSHERSALVGEIPQLHPLAHQRCADLRTGRPSYLALLAVEDDLVVGQVLDQEVRHEGLVLPQLRGPVHRPDDMPVIVLIGFSYIDHHHCKSQPSAISSRGRGRRGYLCELMTMMMTLKQLIA